MVYNFEHEVSDIRDHYLLHLISQNLFHDGYIFEIKFLNGGKDVRLVVSCERDWAAEHGVIGSIPPGKTVPDDRFDDRFRYVLTFKDCRYFVRETSSFPLEYLNGRFKDSARLAIVKSPSKNRRRYHHLRIQTHGGYLDIIFSDFSATKLQGEIKLPHRIDQIRPFLLLSKNIGIWTLDRYEGSPEQERITTAGWLYNTSAMSTIRQSLICPYSTYR